MTEEGSRPAAVVFDIGNVLIRWQPLAFYDRVIGPDRRRKLFAGVGLLAMNDRIDRGAPFRESVEAVAAAHPEWAGEIRFWHDRWPEMAASPIAGSVRLLRALRSRGVPVFALSNFGIEPFALAEARHPFLAEFDIRLLSGPLGIAKPDAAIYARLEAECGIAPERLLFTDDNAANIAAARERGWQTHLFTGVAGWGRRLVAAGLLAVQEAGL